MSESKLWPDGVMKPMMIIPPEEMTAEDIAELRKNNICVVVAKNPAVVRFVDPIPAVSSRTELEQACIQLSKRIMSKGYWTDPDGPPRRAILSTFIECLVKGTPLDPNPSPTQAEVEKREYDQTRIDEVRRIAREDARAERVAKKAAATTPKK